MQNAPLQVLKTLVALVNEAPEGETGEIVSRFHRETLRFRSGLDAEEFEFGLRWLSDNRLGTREPYVKISRKDGGVWLTSRGADAYEVLEAFGVV